MDSQKIYVGGEEGGSGMNPMLATLLNNGGFGGYGNGGWLWFFFLFLLFGWRGNGFGFGNGGDAGLANMVNNDANRDLFMSAVAGNLKYIKIGNWNTSKSVTIVHRNL